MTTDVAVPAIPKAARIAGYVVSLAPSAMLLMSGVMKFSKSDQLVEGFNHLGWKPEAAMALGIVELVSLALYWIPQTAVLGAVLLTGYLGGAIASHARLGEPFIAPAVLGVLVWGGLYLRDRKIRDLLPWRK